MSSCVSMKKVKYFSDLPDTISEPIVVSQPAPFIEPKIESNDILAITLQTITQNSGNTPITTNAVGSFNPLNGNLVDKDGNMLSMGTATIRLVCQVALCFIPIVGGILDLIWPLFDDPTRQTLHDKAVASYVIKVG